MRYETYTRYGLIGRIEVQDTVNGEEVSATKIFGEPLDPDETDIDAVADDLIKKVVDQ